MKKIILTFMLALAALGALSACAPANEPLPENPVQVATLAGPTGMGIVKMIDNPGYDISVFNSPDQITPKIINGEVSVATVPSNVAALLYNKTKGGIKVVGVNTMGVLYIVENGDTVSDIKDLEGKTLYATGQGATPEYALEKILSFNGIENVTVKYMGAHADLANAVAAGDITLALLPEPFISTVLAKNEEVEVKIDFNVEWKKIFGEDAGMPMGVAVVSSEFAEDEASMERLIADYTDSVNYVVGNPKSAAADIAEKQIVGSAAIAEAAIPRSGITFATKDACKTILDGYFEVMYQSNPESLGGSIPDDGIYYLP